MKILILLVIGYFFYQAIKKWMFANVQPREHVARDDVAEIDDVMIKDPVCGAYFPKRNGVRWNFKGDELIFCSQECKQKFIQSNESE